MLKNIGSSELVVIAGLMMFLFGGKKLPELAKGISGSIKEFKSALKE